MKISYYMYILTNTNRRLYVGMTSNLQNRIHQHVTGKKGHASSYRIHTLIYFEEFHDPRIALDREKQIKRWRRKKKIALIESVNPDWVPIEIY